MRGNDGTYIWFASKWGMVAVDAPCNVTPIEVSEKNDKGIYFLIMGKKVYRVVLK